ncbi:FMN-binding protein [Clostridium sp.]|uniref:FMN-binding protein n=1 Tax=Clostridium sp. TaxID=1506 RepID=UPI003F33AF69
MKSKKIKLLTLTLVTVLSLSLFAGCTNSDEKTDKQPEAADTTTQASEAPAVTDLEWDAQPQLGLIKGQYYKLEERFRQGHLGILEVVKNNDKIVEVEFNEMTRPNYYKRYYQDVPKRNSEYNFDMGAAKGAAWIQSVVNVENQMIKEQRLTGDFDVVSGASNSIEQAMAPMAVKVNEMMVNPSDINYYAIAEELGGGLTGKLKVLVQNGKIIECKYDEIFANSPDDIENPELKKYYRVSKYESIEYHEPSRIGFNIQMDELNAKVIETQDLFDLTGLPAIEATGDYKSSGYTERNSAWDNYLKLAEKLHTEMKADGVL